MNTTTNAGSAASGAALALANASAAAGVAGAEAGYALTQKAVTESGAPAVLPLLLLEFAAIAAGFAAYAETAAAWDLAQASTKVTAKAAELTWGPGA